VRVRCPRCRHENPPQSRYCSECGARLALACAGCGAEILPGAKFCSQCGRPAVEQARYASPDAYTPKHLAERILTSRSALEGERKQVTVLFADLKGSMELLAERDPEEARKVLDPVLERMMEAVHHYEGTVNQVMGDGVMALFGAPLAHEDHALRACYAALDMQAAIRRYADEVRRSHGIAVEIRVGVNSGEVVVRAIGSDLHMDYTAVGQSTHLAARMEQLASPGRILLTADTFRLAEGYVEVKPLGPVPVKGLASPIEVYELVGGGPLRSRLRAAAVRGLTRFVGRSDELEQLHQLLGRAAAGHGQLVAIVGDAGVGKSRLVWELTHSDRTRGWLMLEANAVSYGKAMPYLPVVNLLKAYFEIEDRDDHRKVREKIGGRLTALDEALKPALPSILALLDVPVEDPDWQALDPPQRRQETLKALKRLILRECRAQPVLVVFEDLHWIDTETQALLDSLVESLPTARLLLLVNYRPEYHHGWSNKTFYTQLRLDPLPSESMQELLDLLLGRDHGLQPVKELLVERTEGNPFFLEESVRTLVETNVLVGEHGAYRLAEAPGRIQAPATVRAVLASRIDRLPTEEKALLQIASVIGKDVPFLLLRAIAGQPEDTLRRLLRPLQAAEFLYEVSLFPELEFTFKHALTHEVAYSSLLLERRRGLHAEIVQAVERLHAGRLDEQVDRLAHHALRGELWNKAVTYLRRAGVRAEARAANREAVAYFEQALGALRHLPETRATLETAIDVRFELRRSLQQLGEMQRTMSYLREAQIRAEELGDELRLARVLASMSTVAWLTEDQASALELGERAYAIAGRTGDLAVRVDAAARLGWVHHALGDFERAAQLCREVIETLGGSLVRERLGHIALPAVQSRAWLAWCLAERGEFPEALAHGREALRLAEVVGHALSEVTAVFVLCVVHLLRGEAEEALSLAERTRRLAQTTNFAFGIVLGPPLRGLAYAQAGRMGEALPLLEMGVRINATTHLRIFYSLRTRFLAEAYLLGGLTAQAAGQATEALNCARRQRERGCEAWALHLLGDIQARDERGVKSAADYYQEATTLASELGMRPLVAHCHLGLGRLYQRTGKREQAREHLMTATTMYREMDMRSWLVQAEADLGVLA
jgi:class 3 adenylate cyclase/tetratricopeptide (TPR) repeat protein